MIAGDTIVAVSSAVGQAPRMIVRLSGPECLDIVSTMAGRISGTPSAARVWLRLRDWSVPVWLYVFIGPRSYTAEDIVEIHLPGNPLLTRLLVQQLLASGARQAEPGEFTARAFFNGRIGLAEAEGVAATISAHGEDERRAARRLLAGELTRRLDQPVETLTEALSLIETSIDFSDQGIELIARADLHQRIAATLESIRRLVRDSSRFERLSHEAEFVLVGRPNAGKSTLLNALCGYERAIVSPIPGTTRDRLSVEVVLARGIVRITDAAGISDAASTGAEIEQRMRDRSLLALKQADYVILVRDATDRSPLLSIPRPPDLLVHTKGDLVQSVGNSADGESVLVSAKTGRGMDDLRLRLDCLAFGRPGHSGLALNARHLAAIDEAISCLGRALELSGTDEPAMLAFEVRAALDALGRITGQVSPDEVLGRIFSAFCIGK